MTSVLSHIVIISETKKSAVMDKSTVLVLDNHIPALVTSVEPPSPPVAPMEQECVIEGGHKDEEILELRERLQNTIRVRQIEADQIGRAHV